MAVTVRRESVWYEKGHLKHPFSQRGESGANPSLATPPEGSIYPLTGVTLPAS